MTLCIPKTTKKKTPSSVDLHCIEEYIQKGYSKLLHVTETINSRSVALQGIDNVHSGNCLTVRVLGVGSSITEDTLEELTEGITSLLIDLTGNTLDSTTTGDTTKGGLGDSVDGILDGLTVNSSGSSLSETLTSLTTSRTSRHDVLDWRVVLKLIFFWASRGVAPIGAKRLAVTIFFSPF